MIKNWKGFNEGLLFSNSDEYTEVAKRHKLPKSEILEYFNDIIDDCNFTYGIRQYIPESNKAKLHISISFEKDYKNPLHPRYSNIINSYLGVLSEHTKDIEKIKSACERFSVAEFLEYNGNTLFSPIFSTISKDKETLNFSYEITFKKELETDDFEKSRQEYYAKDPLNRILGEAYEKIVQACIKAGIDEEGARRLIDEHPANDEEYDDRYDDDDDSNELEDYIFAFCTDEGMITIASVNKKTKKLYIDRNEIKNAAHQYTTGGCSDYL